MSSVYVTEFKQNDIVDIVLRDHEDALFGKEYLHTIAGCSVCVTLGCPHGVLAILGYYQPWGGVADVYVLPSIYIHRYAKSFMKYVIAYIDRLSNDLGLHRIQTTSVANGQTDSWMRRLGFTCEGTLVKYTVDGQDYRMWAKVF